MCMKVSISMWHFWLLPLIFFEKTYSKMFLIHRTLRRDRADQPRMPKVQLLVVPVQPSVSKCQRLCPSQEKVLIHSSMRRTISRRIDTSIHS